jgi:hypothetical protein
MKRHAITMTSDQQAALGDALNIERLTQTLVDSLEHHQCVNKRLLELAAHNIDAGFAMLKTAIVGQAALTARKGA